MSEPIAKMNNPMKKASDPGLILGVPSQTFRTSQARQCRAIGGYCGMAFGSFCSFRESPLRARPQIRTSGGGVGSTGPKEVEVAFEFGEVGVAGGEGGFAIGGEGGGEAVGVGQLVVGVQLGGEFGEFVAGV